MCKDMKRKMEKSQGPAKILHYAMIMLYIHDLNKEKR
jgi:hypothetical protein